MKSNEDRTISRPETQKHIQGQGPNWVLIAGGALLSTLSLRLGYKLKQALEAKRTNDTISPAKGSIMHYLLVNFDVVDILHPFRHSKLWQIQGLENLLLGGGGISEGMVEIKRPPVSPMSKEADLALPLVTIPAPESSRENGAIWPSSPDRLELPHKPFNRSNGSDSPCMSESGSDIYSKREVIQKLRQQLKRRDEMILEMQTQITDLRNSLNIQAAQSGHLQSQLDAANHELFESEREIQRLRKAIADHCVGGMGSPEKHAMNRQLQAEPANGHSNGLQDISGDMDSQSVGTDRGRSGDGERIEMLKREVGDLKEVIEGKDFLLQSYKEQRTELCAKIKELQLGLASQVPSIL
ncbi:hypothetical protein ACLOJK_034097 [Asimina triloba]